ncbi:BON domain-containing protein [Ensifer adhaerens]|uniref:BON domain-containing protein n=1 Tax=Ensifer TaxID=106591 RepID=UPI000DE334DC|nr:MULTISPECIES: BON domain-containing protein [Ensifer]MBK5566570.1 BON domain-containing protein [Ensifer sp. SSB1]MBZ7923935.1 BON domain-containing protein [Ensifer adhaerens]UAX92470.1 BON domain-containing protein [Ensifer adhaerens]UAY00105.1 BON domain-containing protein [Ensifer adhaerens]UAY07488.1 BON domain-containing protein [Ensifer adhaerens]
MPPERPIYAHRDDDPHLRDDALAAKVLRFIGYATMIDTSAVSVMALGEIVVLSGEVASEADISCAGDAAALVVGVASVENRLTTKPDAAD